jgi:hypothetical protein
MPSNIIDLTTQMRDARAAVAQIEKRHRDELREPTAAVYSATDAVVQALGVEHGVDPRTIQLGGWDCDDSPTGRCVYDTKDDYCCDSCLYCGGPDERQ